MSNVLSAGGGCVFSGKPHTGDDNCIVANGFNNNGEDVNYFAGILEGLENWIVYPSEAECMEGEW